MPAVKNVGEPCAGEPHTQFEVAVGGNQASRLVVRPRRLPPTLLPVKRAEHSSLADAADYGYCASHSCHFWGFCLHALFALDGTLRALVLTSSKIDEKLVCLQMIARCERQPGQMLILIGDKNFRGKDFEAELANLDATIMRPRRKDEPGHGLHLAPIRQCIESIFWTCKDILKRWSATAAARRATLRSSKRRLRAAG